MGILTTENTESTESTENTEEKIMNDVAVKEYLNEFRDALLLGIENLVKAGEIYVRAIDSDPGLAYVFRDEYEDWLPASAWVQLEAVGRKWIHPKLLMGIIDPKKERYIKPLPYSMQARVLDHSERFELLLVDGDKVAVSIQDATKAQCDQLFEKDHIRSLSEQKAYLLQKETTLRCEVHPETVPYVIMKGKLIVRRPVTLSRRQVVQILEAMR